MATTSSGEREAVVAIDDLVNELASRVGKMIPRRNDARYPMNAQLIMGRLSAGGVFEEIGRAWGFDLGAQGLGMITDRVVCTGDEMHVRLRGLDGCDYLLPMRVTHTDRLFGNVYRIGGQFLFTNSAAAAA
ncbi:MAG TPA: hypothetical protein VGR35_02670 [Tepidisphaeraceae bacterium]|nr:hypothetical protein [Tepidisphaeraceae bacterium]